jgi:hypothetical protein
MELLPEHLTAYLRQTLHMEPELSSVHLQGLPVYLAHLYRFWQARLFGREFVLAEATADVGGGAKRLAADLERLKDFAGEAHLAVVLPRLSSVQRRRLIAAGVPFLIPGQQMYLPTVLVDLREHFPRAVAPPPAHLTATAQFVILRQILWRDVEGRHLAGLAEEFGYSAMTLTNVRRDLIAAGVCEDRAEGRAKPLRFRKAGRDLWESVRTMLRSPVVREVPAVAVNPSLPLLDAGLTALARRSMLAAPPVPTTALAQGRLRSALDKDDLVKVGHPDYAEVFVQAWAYNPGRLAEEDLVDPLSLWLSLMEDPDERVQLALDELLEGQEW